jgi:hypothetical protein
MEYYFDFVPLTVWPHWQDWTQSMKVITYAEILQAERNGSGIMAGWLAGKLRTRYREALELLKDDFYLIEPNKDNAIRYLSVSQSTGSSQNCRETTD